MTPALPSLPITVVIPVRNGDDFIGECLRSVVANRPRQIVVVDGQSTDRTLAIVEEIARELADDDDEPQIEVLDDGGSGVAGARMLGAGHARYDVVTLVDADVVLPDDSLSTWYAEFRLGRYDGLQAGLHSESMKGDYWGRALAEHQRISRSRYWFSLSVTMFDRRVLEQYGLDPRFKSGEDIEFRHRLGRLGLRIAVSRTVFVRHRFRDSFQDARHQWRDDGAGLARVVRLNGVRDAHLVALPAAATVRGLWLTVLRAPWMIAYWVCFFVFNYVSMLRVLFSRHALDDPKAEGDEELGLRGNSGALTATRVLPMVVGFLSWTFAARIFAPGAVGLAAAAVSAAALVSQIAVAGHGQALVQLLPKDPTGGRRMVAVGAAVAAVAGLACSGLLVVAANAFTPRLRGIVSSPSALALFLALGTATAVAYYYDHAAVAHRRSDLALVRSLMQSGCLLVAVLVGWAVADRNDGLPVLMFGAATGVVSSTVLGVWQEARRPRLAATGTAPKALRALGRTGLPNFVLTLVHRTPMFVLPFLITELISAASNAAWYVAWMMAMAIWFVPNSVGYSLQARLARPGLSAHDEAEEIRGALRSATLLAVAAAVGVAVVGPLLLHVMGPVYQSATRALWVLCIAVLPTIFSEVWLAACRVRRRWRLPIALYAVVGCSVLGGAMVIAHRGIADVAVLWLAAQVVIGSCAWWSLHTELRRPRANSSVRGRFLARASS